MFTSFFRAISFSNDWVKIKTSPNLQFFFKYNVELYMNSSSSSNSGAQWIHNNAPVEVWRYLVSSMNCIGNGDPIHEVCIPHSIPRAWEQQGWKQEQGADTSVIAIESSKKSGRTERGHEGQKSQTSLN